MKREKRLDVLWRSAPCARAWCTLVFCAGMAMACSAEDFTFNWPRAFPDTGDTICYRDGNGKVRLEITLFYTNITASLSSPKRWCIDAMRAYPDEGGTITITGEPMTFIVPTARSEVFLHTNDCRLVFQNVVTNRTTYYRYAGPAKASDIDWYGGATFLSTNWTLIAANANVADYEPISTCQQKTPEGVELTGSWYNPNNIHYPENFVRRDGSATFQYSNYASGLCKVVKMELKQGAEGIYARVLSPPYGLWYTNGSSGFLKGTDPDMVDGSDNGTGAWKQNFGLYCNTSEFRSGYGINRVYLDALPPATVRFENRAYFLANVTSRKDVRVEFAGDSEGVRVKDGACGLAPWDAGSEIVFQNASVDSWVVGNALQRMGRYVFERTTEGSSTFCLDGDTVNVMMEDSRMVVRGTTDGSGRMVLRVQSPNQMPSSNNIIRVEKGGELFLDYSTGKEYGGYRIVVCPGGTLRQNGLNTFRDSGKRVIVDGGTLELGASTQTKPYLHHVTLKNGAEMRTGTATECILSGTYGNRLIVCGDSPSTNNAAVALIRGTLPAGDDNAVSTNVFHVATTGAGTYDADFVQEGDVNGYTGSDSYRRCKFLKSGAGTMLLNGDFAATNEAIIAEGTLKFGGGAWTNTVWKAAAAIALEGGNLAVADGKAMTVGRLSRLTSDAQITLGANSSLSFLDSSGDAAGWDEGARLSIVAPEGAFVRFGNGSGGLSGVQLGSIRLNGRRVTTAGDGRIVPRGTMFVLR